MTVILGENSYGKSRVRLVKVIRDHQQHHVSEWTIDVWLQGDFTACFKEGDNTRLLPTDTMKNTVYSLARDSRARAMEDFGHELVHHFIDGNPYVELAGVRILSTSWKHLEAGGAIFPSAFTHAGDGRNVTTITKSREGQVSIHSGVEDLWLLKTAHSAFAGFMRDRLTTLKETRDRLLGTLARVTWTYSTSALDFDAVRESVSTSLLQAFARHDSLSVQQTLYEMAQAALEHVPQIAEIHLFLPNKHCNLVDLSAFGQDNPNCIFVPTDEPHGSIEARVKRGQ